MTAGTEQLRGIEQLKGQMRGYLPAGASLSLLERAHAFAAAHLGGSHGGVPHGEAVSAILAGLGLDLTSVVAGMVHAMPGMEQGGAEEIARLLDPEVATLVGEVARLSKATFHGTEAARAEHMRQMILASTRDLRVIMVLLADRLQHLREARGENGEMESLARETMAIYAPIAHRLGIHSFKDELEDRAFEILEPEEYASLQARVDARIAERSERITRINQELRDLLTEHGIEGEVLGRTKHLYSVHNKIKKRRVAFEEIFDLLATRIIVNNTEECYRVLGLVHARYTPLPGRFKDYIALPKENGYRSLHTLVFGEQGELFETQIRSREMHEKAEMGVAAHFVYKGGSAPDPVELESVAWFRSLLENLEEGQSGAESMEMLERGLAPDQIFVFTPTGEVIKLPGQATPIDFAYAIHSEVGHRCTGARVDGRMISIRTPLRNGHVVEIINNSKQEPTEDWLKYALTSKAQGHIRAFLRRKEKQEALRTGRERVARAAKAAGWKVDALLENATFTEWMERNALAHAEDLYAAEGFGRVHLAEVLTRLFPPPEEAGDAAARARKPAKGARAAKKQPASKKKKAVVAIGGLDNVVLRFAGCCQPVHGDPVVGIITRERGVSIHHRDCRNLARQVFHAERMVDVSWVDEDQREQPVTLAIRSRKSMKELLNLINILEDEEKMHITAGHIVAQGSVYTQHLTMLVSNAQRIEQILQRLNTMEGIRAERVFESA